MRNLTLAAAMTAISLSLSAPVAAAGLSSLYSCDAEGSTNTKAALVGGLVGALAGSQVSKKNRALGAAIGAGLGAAIGNGVGCRMDRKAQQDARQAFQRALDTGQAQNWADPTTGASGRVEVVGEGPQRSAYGAGSRNDGRWRFASGVTPASRVSSQGGPYAGAARVNVRAGPSASAAVIDRLRAGEQIEVAGSVAGGWLAVVEDGMIQGYVASSVVRPTGRSAGADCRLVEQTVTERAQAPVRERYNACRDERGSWNLTGA